VTAGFHSPLPPARTGVADYSAALLRALQKLGDVRPDATAADVHLYHIGNNQLHRAIYQCALASPGVAVLHDAVLQHLFLGALSENEYADEFAYNYGEWHRDRGRQLWLARATSASDERYFRYPMLRRIAECSRAVVVHNPGAADIPVYAYLFGVFGFLRESKRLLAVLDAFLRLREAIPDSTKIALLIAGDFVSTDLARACNPWLASPGVYRVPYLDEREFWAAASAVDACVNLRAPAAGETSGIAIRLMGTGKPVLLTEAPENSDFPKGSYFPVPAGVAESAALFDYMGILIQDRSLGRDIGRMAAEHIGREHSLERISQIYWDLLCRHAVSPSSD